jgi:general secretion pathway protein G
MPKSRRGVSSGLTLIELLITISVIAILGSIAVPKYWASQEVDRNSQVTDDIRAIAFQIDLHAAIHKELPATLPIAKLDPWGNPYRYTNFALARKHTTKDGKPGTQRIRTNKILGPVNSDYDLWSMGPDGASNPKLTAKTSRDDIIRADDGRYIGPASEY